MYKNLNPLLHSELRLAIISTLITDNSFDFNKLKELTNASSGNLSVQLKKLEKAGYILITKGFKNNYQHTSVAITKLGLHAFEDYVKVLKTYIEK